MAILPKKSFTGCQIGSTKVMSDVFHNPPPTLPKKTVLRLASFKSTQTARVLPPQFLGPNSTQLILFITAALLTVFVLENSQAGSSRSVGA